MILYDCKTAPSPRRARVFLAEKGIDAEIRQVDLAGGEHLGEAFIALNPLATVPVLVTDEGVAITENNGIAAYLEALKPEPALLGTTPTDQGLVWTWNAICEQQGFLAIAEAFRNAVPGLASRALTGPAGFEQIPALAERGRKRVALFFDLLEKRLESRDYLATDTYSLADISALIAVDFAARAKLPVPEGHSALRAWHARVSARPSAKA